MNDESIAADALDLTEALKDGYLRRVLVGSTGESVDVGIHRLRMLLAPDQDEQERVIGLSFRGDIETVIEELQADIGGLSLSIVTGEIAAEDLAPLSRFRSRFEIITVVQFNEDGAGWDRAGIPEATMIGAASSEEFARAWNQAAR